MPDTPDSPVYLVDVTEHSTYVVRIDQAVLGLPADATPTQITDALTQAADLMVSNRHPDAVRADADREVGTITRCGPAPVTPS